MSLDLKILVLSTSVPCPICLVLLDFSVIVASTDFFIQLSAHSETIAGPCT